MHAARNQTPPIEREAIAKVFRADLVEPGKTQLKDLPNLLGKPVRHVQETGHHDFYFYDLGEGASMDATVSVRAGVIEYVSYLCSESLSDIHKRFSGEASTQRSISTGVNGMTSTLTQVVYQSKGRAYVYEPRTYRVRACVAWEPGKKFEELGF
ncbi:MAG: hypothetical protein HY074_02585 [Deltaproteobacteria bacterium]|nr:hypothetical protein [Deltaproteobacteria bacterium]